MNHADDLRSYRWPALTAPRCTTHLAGGVLVCRGDRGHAGGHTYLGSSHIDRQHDDGEK